MKTLPTSDRAAIAMLATMGLLGIATWPVAPHQMPVHWVPAHWIWPGPPDRLGDRFEALFAVPIAATVIYLIQLAVPRLDPRRANYEAFTGAYAALRTLVVGEALALQVLVVLSARGLPVDGARMVSFVAGTGLIGVGNYLPKIKSNWFIGVRTPWTLSSEEAWRKTHRLAGWLFVASGALSIAAALADSHAGLPTLVISIGAAVVTSAVYSYFAWKADVSRPGPGLTA